MQWPKGGSPVTVLCRARPTDQGGNFRFSTLGEGAYVLRVTGARSVRDLTVKAGQTPEPVEFRVKIGEYSDLRPVDAD